MALAEGLDIKLNAAVKKVEYNHQGVEVTVYNPRNQQTINTYRGEYFFLFENHIALCAATHFYRVFRLISPREISVKI